LWMNLSIADQNLSGLFIAQQNIRACLRCGLLE